MKFIACFLFAALFKLNTCQLSNCKVFQLIRADNTWHQLSSPVSLTRSHTLSTNSLKHIHSVSNHSSSAGIPPSYLSTQPLICTQHISRAELIGGHEISAILPGPILRASPPSRERKDGWLVTGMAQGTGNCICDSHSVCVEEWLHSCDVGRGCGGSGGAWLVEVGRVFRDAK